MAHMPKRMRRRIKLLRTRRGRLIRDIRRKTDGNEGLEETFAIVLSQACLTSAPMGHIGGFS